MQWLRGHPSTMWTVKGEGGFLKKPCRSTRGGGGVRGWSTWTIFLHTTAQNAVVLRAFGVFIYIVTIRFFVKNMQSHMT